MNRCGSRTGNLDVGRQFPNFHVSALNEVSSRCRASPLTLSLSHKGEGLCKAVLRHCELVCIPKRESGVQGKQRVVALDSRFRGNDRRRWCLFMRLPLETGEPCESRAPVMRRASASLRALTATRRSRYEQPAAEHPIQRSDRSHGRERSARAPSTRPLSIFRGVRRLISFTMGLMSLSIDNLLPAFGAVQRRSRSPTPTRCS